MSRQNYLSLIFTTLSCLYSGHALGAQLLINGGFETGSLENWEDHSVGKAVVAVVQRDTCFSTSDTRGIQIRGRHAALLRGDTSKAGTSSEASFATLRSNAFTAGDGLAFIALRSSINNALKNAEFGLRAEILDVQTNTVLVSQRFSPAAIQLSEACPSAQITGQFSSHYFDTRSYAGQAIKIQFTQPVDSMSDSFFTLIDQLVLFKSGEQALFFSRPYAQAGIGITSNGIPYLDSRGSFDPDRNPAELSYSWWLKTRQYQSARPCLTDISSGSHQAVLYVNDGHHAISDSLQFYLHAAVGKVALNGDLQCNLQILPVSDKKQSRIEAEKTTQEQAIKAVSTPEGSGVTAADSSQVIKSKPLIKPIEKIAKAVTTLAPQTQNPSGDNGTPGMNASAKSVSKGNTILESTSTGLTTNQVLTRVIPAIKSKQTGTLIEKNNAATPEKPAKITKHVEIQTPELTELNLKAYHLGKSGIRWEPGSRLDGKLLITTPAFFPKQVVKLIDRNGELIETASEAARPGKRARYTFKRAGAAYPLNCILRVGNTDYLVKTPANPVN